MTAPRFELGCLRAAITRIDQDTAQKAGNSGMEAILRVAASDPQGSPSGILAWMLKRLLALELWEADGIIPETGKAWLPPGDPRLATGGIVIPTPDGQLAGLADGGKSKPAYPSTGGGMAMHPPPSNT